MMCPNGYIVKSCRVNEIERIYDIKCQRFLRLSWSSGNRSIFHMVLQMTWFNRVASYLRMMQKWLSTEIHPVTCTEIYNHPTTALTIWKLKLISYICLHKVSWTIGFQQQWNLPSYMYLLFSVLGVSCSHKSYLIYGLLTLSYIQTASIVVENISHKIRPENTLLSCFTRLKDRRRYALRQDMCQSTSKCTSGRIDGDITRADNSKANNQDEKI